MRIAIVGSEGSIGKKRSLILESMGHKVVRYDKVLKNVFNHIQAKEVDGVIACTPPADLCDVARDCITSRTPFFLEKPGATNFREFLSVVGMVEKSDMPTMVACNLRFTSEYKAIKESLPNIGKPVFASAEFGYFLPWWREGNYKTYYSCFRMAGGGVLMDAIHEIDYMSDLFGMPKTLSNCMVKKENSGELEALDCEDNVTLLGIYNNGPAITIHLDYLQRAYKRTFSAVGTKGRIDQVFNVQGSSNMYRNEMQHFIDCIKTGKESINPIERWSEILEFVDKIRNVEPRKNIEEA